MLLFFQIFMVISFYIVNKLIQSQLAINMQQQKQKIRESKKRQSQQNKTMKQRIGLFQIEQCTNRSFKIQSNSNQHISTNEKTLTVKCIQDDQEPSVVKTVEAFNLHALVSYFEIKIMNKALGQNHRVYVGLISNQTSLRKFPGTTLNSIGFSGSVIHHFIKNSDGTDSLKISKVCNGKVPNKDSFLGIGVNTVQKNIFFTFDGSIIEEIVRFEEQPQWTQLYPCLCLSKQGDQLKFIFDKNHMKFNLEDYEKQQKYKMRKQIYNIDCNVSNSTCVMTGLVDQYLLFHGYSKTLQRLRQQRSDSYRSLKLLSFAKSPQQNQQKQPIKVINTQEMMNQNLKNKKQQAIHAQQNAQYKSEQAQSQDSDLKYLTDQRPIDIKKTQIKYQKQQQTLDFGRKYSDAKHQRLNDKQKKIDKAKEAEKDMFALSNISNQSDQQINYGNLRSSGNIKTPTQVQVFLEKGRLDIIYCIKEERIQEATKIIKLIIPALFEKQFYVEVFLKGHIFIRKIKRQSPLNAVKFAKQDKSFQKHQNILFPAYDNKSDRLNWIPLKQIFALLVDTTNKQGLLKPKQFQILAQYVNQVILRNLGYHEYSRLQTCMHHIIEVSKQMRLHNFVGPVLKFPK